MSINPVKFVQAFHAVRKAYNVQAVHVKTLADEMEVSTIDLVQFLDDNKSIAVAYDLDGTSRIQQGLYIGDVGDPILTHARFTVKHEETADKDHLLVVTLIGGEFVDESEAEDVDNYIIDVGDTDITASTITATVNEDDPIVEVKIVINKAPSAGEIVMVIRPAALKNGNFSEVCTLVIDAAEEA